MAMYIRLSAQARPGKTKSDFRLHVWISRFKFHGGKWTWRSFYEGSFTILQPTAAAGFIHNHITAGMWRKKKECIFVGLKSRHAEKHYLYFF